MGTIILLGLIWFAIYKIDVKFWPFKACKPCSGRGEFRSPFSRSWRHCGPCGGSGETLRRGARR